MKCFLKITTLSIVLSCLSSCITYEPIAQPKFGSDLKKVERFDYMETQWSYLYSRWITSQKIMPDDLVHIYEIPYEQAKSEVDEFVKLQYNYNWFHCFLISIYLNEIRFYVNYN